MNDKLRNSLLFNIIVVLLVCTGLYMVFFGSLGILTKHSSQATVPSTISKNVKTAKVQLEHMGFDVEVDSSYDPQQRPFVVLAQVPDPGSVVKKGRTIFLTVNKAEPPLTPMPKLTDLSYRSATLILKSAKLVLGDTIHKPDYAKGAVLDQLFKGQSIKAGDMVPQGSRIDLVIGDGFGNVEMNVPDVIGLTAEEGLSLLYGNGLTPTIIWDDPIDDSATAIIYRQTPAPYNELDVPNRIKEGDVIDIRIKQQASNEELENNRKPSSGVNTGDPNAEPSE